MGGLFQDFRGRGRVRDSASIPQGQPFPWIFPALPFMMHRVQNQIWTFCPFPFEIFEIGQLCEPPGQSKNLDMGLLIAWGLCEAVERTEIQELGVGVALALLQFHCLTSGKSLNFAVLSKYLLLLLLLILSSLSTFCKPQERLEDL